MKELNLRKYKDKYKFIKDIYKPIRNELRINNKRITYSTYFKVITSFLEELIKEIAVEKAKFVLPYGLGKVYIKKELHKRPFHIQIDIKESEKKGELVKYKVPILDDYYNKLVWERPTTYKRYKILPLNKFKKLINRVKEY
tara:strand:+ start:12352 stop:12774 length:423 start_codon:yes stop_codon:yes gene_type:complete